jgi:iron complex outermembrane receptor protein
VKQRSRPVWSSTILIAIVFLVIGAQTQTQEKPKDLTDLSLEDLMNVTVTSVARKEQKLSHSAAAVYVITQEDIRRSGVTNIPDALRMAPGVDVAQISASAWAISIRGFADHFANKVLVLVDGRSVYSASFSGVYWDAQDVPLEDIDRIEVIRGPGGTVWGANAVNGVINIITKKASETRGRLVTTTGGSQEKAQGLLQYGGQAGTKMDYRAFARYSTLGDGQFPNGTQAADGWLVAHGGFRSDWQLSQRDTMTIQGDLLADQAGETVTEAFSNTLKSATFNYITKFRSGNIQGRWTRTLSDNSDLSLQAYYDDYTIQQDGFIDSRRTFDLDFNHHFALNGRNDIVWGLGYRVSPDNFTPGYSLSLLPPRRTDNLFTSFLQDEIKITKSLWFTLGAKLEHNGYTGFTTESGAQLLWTPTQRQAAWLSIMRAIRQPSRADTDTQVDLSIVPLPNGLPGVVHLTTDPILAGEERVVSLQAGYRKQINSRLSVDLAAFGNFYADLTTFETQPPFFAAAPLPHIVLPVFGDDKGSAVSAGGEVYFNWNATRHWRIIPEYSLTTLDVGHTKISNDTNLQRLEEQRAEHKVGFRSLLTLPHNLECDNTMNYVSRLSVGIPAYTRFDTRLGWKASERTEISIIGQNLLSPRHPEFFDSFTIHNTAVQRSVFGKITWRF